ncbi:TetR/AcrR family transcriptional regulator [Gemmatimonas sp.]|jgi:AcrR family transcriptional regulator|uniref:TetR/AcrR family transcriptional regulator n=1 Tax=Gemmatimonas sp. TaxID=1962908 RepID=UPI0037BEA023
MIAHHAPPTADLGEKSPTTRAERVRTRSIARREAERLQLRDTVLEIASRQLVANGYERFSLREVAEEAGYSPTALYRYFADRDALLEEVCQGYFAQFGEVLRAADRSATMPRERLLAQAQAYVQYAIENPAIYKLMFLERPDWGMGMSMDDVAADTGFMVLSDAVAALAAAGGLGKLEVGPASLILWSGVHGMAAMAVTMNLLPPAQLLAMTHAMSEVVLAGFHSP